MNRKSFLAKTSVAMSSLVITRDIFARKKDPVYGHGNMQYGLNNQWGKLNPQQHPVNDCHEMVQDSKGRIILLTNETKNNLLFYDKSGKYLSSWGHDFPGAHGLTLTNENGAEFFFITDTAKHQVYKATIDGKILFTIDPPMETGLYKKPEDFVPTEVAVDDNGDFFIADGYGQQYVLQYDRAGKLKGYFGGRGLGDNHLDNAHGIVFDNRNGQHSLLVTDPTLLQTLYARWQVAGGDQPAGSLRLSSSNQGKLSLRRRTHFSRPWYQRKRLRHHPRPEQQSGF